MTVEKKRFSSNDFKTVQGERIPVAEIGWESYGELNEDKSNAILVAHFFSSNSHAAGKYSESDLMPGYWDGIIGPGKAIDTDKYFVISSDSLVNASAFDDNVITTGPSTINPETGRPYGMSFPVVSIRDFVNLQHELVTSLGITKLHAVAGPSMGSHQALEWASCFPDMVERVISVIGLAETNTFGVAQLENWISPIKQDPNWHEGNYFDFDTKPIAGLRNALRNIYLTAHHDRILSQIVDKSEDEKAKVSIKDDFGVNKHMLSEVDKNIGKVDPNHLIYLARACQNFRVGHKETLVEGLDAINAKILLMPSENDELIPAKYAKQLAGILKDLDKEVTYEELKGDWGHLNGVVTIHQNTETIANFLAN